MKDEHAEMQALLADFWSSGETGKALLLRDGTLRSWRTLSLGSPHHVDAQQALGISTEAVVAYLVIEPDGAVIAMMTKTAEAEALVSRALEADPRLHRASGGWDFS